MSLIVPNQKVNLGIPIGLARGSHEMENMTEALGPGDQEDVHRFSEIVLPPS